MNLLELFKPYISFITFFITILINIYLLLKGINWISLLIGNLIIILVFEFLNIAEYNLLNQIIEFIIDFIGGIIKGIWDRTIGGFLRSLGEWLGFSPASTGDGGAFSGGSSNGDGGGGFGGR